MCTGVGVKWLIGAFFAIYGKIVPPEIEKKKAVLGQFLAFLGKNERGENCFLSATTTAWHRSARMNANFAGGHWLFFWRRSCQK